MFAVDGDELCTRSQSQRLHEWARRNKTFFVCEPECFACAKSFERDRQPRESDNAIDDNIGNIDNVGQRAGYGDSGQCIGNFGATYFVGHYD
jgi:hypothetical protein